jgi:hypothetical protein
LRWKVGDDSTKSPLQYYFANCGDWLRH